MTELFSSNEPLIRSGAFAAILCVMMAWEVVAPRRHRTASKWIRWLSNMGIVVLNTVLLRLLLPVAAVGAAELCARAGWGLFNVYSPPAAVAVVASVVLLDLAIYGQHVAFHYVPLLWRVHRMHHADLDFDVTTGVRFHPIEILISMLVKMTVVLVIGAPVIAVIAFEVLLSATSLFNHGNVRISPVLDGFLRLIVVTPDMHRVHHSVIPAETNSNYGFNLPWWDRLFRTYRAQPAKGHESMTIGLKQFRAQRDLRLDRMLLQPFR